ncbi:hypothetical protein ACOME3_001215 [Neoechinorhynchus agilis]
MGTDNSLGSTREAIMTKIYNVEKEALSNLDELHRLASKINEKLTERIKSNRKKEMRNRAMAGASNNDAFIWSDEGTAERRFPPCNNLAAQSVRTQNIGSY